MNNKVLIEVKSISNKFINYLVYHNIKYSYLIKNNNLYKLIVSYDDYKKINRRYETKIIRYYGLKYYIKAINKHKYILISFIVSLFLLKLLTNTIFNIEIKTDDIQLKNNILNILKNNDIDIYKKKKNFNELNIIKKKILEENNDILEWIEINEKGNKYTVNLTPKVIKNNIVNNTPCDIISDKEGVIKHIVVYSGSKIKEENEYVKKGDVIISGNVYKDESIIDQVKANGQIYAEVWYTSKINIPLKYIDRVKTGKIVNHYYVELFNHKFSLIGKYESKNSMNEKKVLIDKPYLKFKLYREIKTEYEYKEFNLTHDEAYNEGLKRSDEYMEKTLSDGEYIISKNVLKKQVNSSKMYIEVFYKVYESIGVTSKILEKEDLNEISSNASS